MNFGEYLKMFGRKSRDLLVKVATCQEAFEKKFDNHVVDEKETITAQGKRFDGIEKLIKECHGTCSETDRITETSDTLLRMEEKYDGFYEEQSDKQDKLGNEIAAMKTAKKSKRELLADAAKVLAAIALVCGIVFGIIRYSGVLKSNDNEKIETMLEELLDK